MRNIFSLSIGLMVALVGFMGMAFAAPMPAPTVLTMHIASMESDPGFINAEFADPGSGGSGQVIYLLSSTDTIIYFEGIWAKTFKKLSGDAGTSGYSKEWDRSAEGSGGFKCPGGGTDCSYEGWGG